ncbi:bifunctional tryptophan synthase trp1, partial [Chytridiales sp. JEL 0842]
RGKTAEEDEELAQDLLSDLKERSEHIMLVDLGRNDVNRVCVPKTVTVDSLMHIERYSHVMHIVSNVSGTLRKDKTMYDAFRSIFPAGTVSGSPKIRAMQLISELEQEKRGIYAGAVGYFSYSGNLDTCIAIRTMMFKNGYVHLQAGAGIVYDSVPTSEWNETMHKLNSNLTAIKLAEKYYYSLQQKKIESKTPLLQEVPHEETVSNGAGVESLSTPSKPITNKPTEPSIRPTILIDNYDSFTFNVYQYLSDLGANVIVYRNDEVTVKDCIALNPRNIVISPGPGHPRESGISMDVIRAFAGKVPIFGVCLGEQCMFELYGGTVTYAGEIVHGKTSPIQHDGKGLYAGVSQGLECTRYHSLAGDKKTLPDCLEVTSTTENGIVMGVRHKEFVMEGVQYHPESIASEEGMKMFANFLRWEGGRWDSLKIREDLAVWPRPEDAEGGRGKKRTGEQRTDGIPLSKMSKLNSTAAVNGSNGSSASGGPSILKTIEAKRKNDVASLKSTPGLAEKDLLRSLALGMAPKQIDFPARILASCKTATAVMAEIKRASPSKGAID